DFKIKFLGKKTLKGFDADIVHTYEVLESSSPTQEALAGVSECPDCGDILSLENDDKGHFVFFCKSCLNVVPIDGSKSVGKSNSVA
ncbi:MAG: hypothetical protein KDD38_01870, partial [Bdellovibrionales bacterium]|nr:hypothetical protein [Bdellovibrionales bacterium]